MPRHHRSATGSVRCCTAWHLPLVGMVFAGCGAMLLATGLMQMPTSLTSDDRARMQTGSESRTSDTHTRFLLSAVHHDLQPMVAMRLLPEPPMLATRSPRMLRKTREDGIATVLFSLALSLLHQQFSEDERISRPAVPAEKPDLRRALLAMSAAQHTGHWMTACPCPPRPFTSSVAPVDAPTSGPR
jgi:hypothetical protein